MSGVFTKKLGFPFGIARDLAQIGLQFLLAGTPGEIRVGLIEAELRERLHDLGPGERFRQEQDIRIDCLHFADHPFPEGKGFGVRIVNAEDAHAVLHPKHKHVAERSPYSFS
jgi:hypothetical protein